MKLVDDWKRAHRWFSVQAMAVSTTILAAWAALPDDLKQILPHRAVEGIAAGILVLGVIGRLIKQKETP